MARILETNIDHPNTGCFHHRLQPNPSILLQVPPDPQSSMAVEIRLKGTEIKYNGRKIQLTVLY